MKLLTAYPLLSAVWFSSWVSCGAARLLNSLSELRVDAQYDFIIVGGGTAGSVLANRLTENGEFNVLVVEAGGSNEDILNSEVPYLANSLINGPLDWNYSTVPQAGANERRISTPRGFALGGSSNTMLWYRGSDDMWDNFAKLVGDEDWAWKSVSKYYLKTSRLVTPQDGRDTTGQVDPSAHGDGPVNVTLSSYPQPVIGTVQDAVEKSGGRYTFNLDYNSGNTLGIGWAQCNIGGGVRNSAAAAYLEPAMQRANLDILIHTRAVKLHPVNVSKGIPSINTVELASDANGPRVNVTASKEIILSAGTLNTPQLLLLSGIGPKNDLDALDIPVVLDSPGVGANLTEQPFLPNVFSVTPSTETLDELLRDTTVQAQILSHWQENKTGPYVNALVPIQGNWKLPAGFEDPSSGPGSGNVMVVFIPSYFQYNAPPSAGRYFSVASAILSPKSRGSLKLSSSNPFDPPLVDYAFYSNDFDLNAHVEAMKMIEDFLSLPQFEGIVQGPFGDQANATTDQEKAAFARANVQVYSHPTSSASMGPGGVVDSKLKVKGIGGLRIIDASIFPQIPECNTQAPVYIVAEKAADLLKNDYSSYPN
ncbi:aryl-alcohol oxidase [Moniliophthora roreri MCA 2997]|uniref:Aryl-alcohol oxidase n=1 Tax=Moniliophthora roreri (strain MCA 2997) TaxID=1381753 RepID=V2X1F4_MONRO|nr:aryl-alcohol oxidase [Moniliophthora roreri MCA 2997]